MNPSDSPCFDAHWTIPVAAASRSTTFGSVASWRTTISGRASAIAFDSGTSLPLPPRQML